MIMDDLTAKNIISIIRNRRLNELLTADLAYFENIFLD
jgi:hypothetical protein